MICLSCGKKLEDCVEENLKDRLETLAATERVLRLSFQRKPSSRMDQRFQAALERAQIAPDEKNEDESAKASIIKVQDGIIKSDVEGGKVWQEPLTPSPLEPPLEDKSSEIS